ncbi:MAG: UDP-N-acetylmuramoyl-tripeptide--D-alanyl-D-alanine ligase [Acidimicrobiia bacterium]|nr:UDP-N-acetylmuramoyl-tripeptide--D-alanyl-D-alanine ligase [Acidimicrobiia bacterium]
MRLTVADILETTRGRLLAGTRDASAEGAWFDTRTLPAGSLFLPLAGVRDGHEFIPAAWGAGAVGTLTDRQGIDVPPGRFAVQVDDVLAALTALARAARDQVEQVVAVTGSAGKTTTKDFLAHVLSRSATVGAAPGSFNNEIGVPLTLLNAPAGAAHVIVEIGARHRGDVLAATDVARPDVGIVTNVGSAHIGVFGSRDAIAAAKGELPESLGPEGVAVLNADDPRVLAMAARTSARVVTFGVATHADVRAEGLHHDTDLDARFTLVAGDAAAECRLPAAGPHIVSCALGAAAAAHAVGLRVEEVAVGLGAATRSTHRMQPLESGGGWRVLNDAYNANPESMRAAIEAVSHLTSRGGRPLGIVGHMAELGDHAEEAHREVGRALREARFAAVVGVGEGAELMTDVTAPDAETAAAELRRRAGGFRSGDVILVKASRVVGLESAVTPLLGTGDAEVAVRTERERREPKS